MARLHIHQQLLGSLDGAAYGFGLLIGQQVDGAAVVVDVARTPQPPDDEALGPDWVLVHLQQVKRVVPGGLGVIGIAHTNGADFASSSAVVMQCLQDAQPHQCTWALKDRDQRHTFCLFTPREGPPECRALRAESTAMHIVELRVVTEPWAFATFTCQCSGDARTFAMLPPEGEAEEEDTREAFSDLLRESIVQLLESRLATSVATSSAGALLPSHTRVPFDEHATSDPLPVTLWTEPAACVSAVCRDDRSAGPLGSTALEVVVRGALHSTVSLCRFGEVRWTMGDAVAALKADLAASLADSFEVMSEEVQWSVPPRPGHSLQLQVSLPPLQRLSCEPVLSPVSVPLFRAVLPLSHSFSVVLFSAPPCASRMPCHRRSSLRVANQPRRGHRCCRD